MEKTLAPPAEAARPVAWNYQAATPWLLAGGMLALFLWRLSTMALWDNDETTYAQIAREMVRTGDYITLHFRGHEWFCHPPLYFWMVAVLDQLLGYTELTARLPAAVAGAALISVTYLWGSRLIGHRGALWGALCLGLNFQMYTESRMALLDTTLHVFCFLALLGMTLGLQGDRRGWALMFVASGLACLAKGPFGLVFPWMVLLPYLAWTRQWKRLLDIPWGWAAAALLIGGGWYAVELWLYGKPFFDTVLVYFAVKRMTVAVQGQHGPIWLYFAIMAAGLFPWSCYLPGAMMAAWKRRRDMALAGPLLLVSVVVPLVFFTVAKTKLPNYIVFAYPGACLLVGWYLDMLVATKEARRLAIPTLVALVVGVLFVAGMHYESQFQPQYAAAFPLAEGFCTFFTVAMAVALLTTWRPAGPGPLVPLAVGAVVFLVGLATWLAPLAEPFRFVKPLGEIARPQLTTQDTLAMYDCTGEYGLTFYADHFVLAVRNQEDLRRVFNSPGKVLAVISEKAYQSLVADGGPPVYCLATHGKTMLVSNQPSARVDG